MSLYVITAVLMLASQASSHLHWGALPTFVLSAGAIIPLASILGEATEEVSKRQGPAIGGLLNATFGNATELILAILSLRAGGALVEMVKASLTGSIIGNLLLVLGAAIVAGGLKHKSQPINPASSGMASSMMLLAVIGLVVPAVFAAVSPTASPQVVERLSLAVSFVLIGVYALGLIFSLGTHRHIFDTDDESEPPIWSMRKAVTVLLLATGAVVLESETLVHAVEELISAFKLSPVFLGAVVIAVVGNAAEHAVAILVARKGKMDLAFQIACGSSTQVALFVAPVLVFSSLWIGTPMNLVFSTFQVLSILVSVMIVTAVSSDGETNWFEGAQLLGVYAILCFAFYCM